MRLCVSIVLDLPAISAWLYTAWRVPGSGALGCIKCAMLRMNRHWPHWRQSVLCFCRRANCVEGRGLTLSLLDGAGDAVSVLFCV